MKWILAVFSLLMIAATALPQSQTPIFIAKALTTDIHVMAGSITPPLVLETLQVGTLTPVSGVRVIYSADPGLILVSQQQVTDGKGLASMQCVAVGAQGGHVQAMLSNGAVIRFNVIVDPPGTTLIQPELIALLRVQGTSTLESGGSMHAAVLAANTSGQQTPSAGVPVQISVAYGTTGLLDEAGQPAATLSTQSDAAGEVHFDMQFPLTGHADDLSVVTIAAADARAAIVIHALPPDSAPSLIVVSPDSGTPVPLAPNGSSAAPIQLRLVLANGDPLAGIPLIPAVQSPDQQLTCAETPVFTDSNGDASCHATVHGKAGPGSVSFLAGGLLVSPNVAFVAATGDASVIRILSGNRQSGASGQALPLALTALLMDADGNVVSNAQVTWESDAAVLTGQSKTSNSDGQVTAQVRLGNRPGNATVTVHTATSSATFTLFNNSTGQLTPVDGDGQIANPGQRFGKPLSVRVAAPDGSPVAGATVNFSVIAGSGVLDASQTVTGRDGIAQTAITAGNANGVLGVRASSGADSVEFHLFTLQTAARGITITDWNGQPSYLVPGALMRISFQSAGSVNFQPFTASALPYPTFVGGFRISIGGTSAPIATLSDSDGGLITATIQVPWEVSTQAITSVTIWLNAAATTFAGLPVQLTGPAIQLTDGGRPSLWSLDGSPVQGPVAGGSMLQLQVTGTGALQPAASTNSAGLPGQTPQLPVLAFLDGYGLPLTRADADPQRPSVVDLSITLPRSLTPGKHQLSVGAIITGTLVLSPAAELDIN